MTAMVRQTWVAIAALWTTSATAAEPAAVPPPAATTPAATTTPSLSRLQRLELSLGLGVASGIGLGVGTGLLLQHRQLYANFQPAPNNAGFVTALHRSAAGAGLVGAGLGLGAATLSASLKASDRVLWSILGVGGGLSLIGVAWYASEWPKVQRDLYTSGLAPEDANRGAVRRETAAAAVIGGGLGATVGAGIVLLVQHAHRVHHRRKHHRPTADRSARWSPASGPASLGLSLGFGVQGRF